MTLSEQLKRFAELPEHQSAQPVIARAPSGWEPGVKYSHDGMTVTSPVMVKLADGDFVPAVESMGVDIPDGWEVRLVEARFDPAAWQREGEGTAYTGPVWRYKFLVVPGRVPVDFEIGAPKPVRKTFPANEVFLVALSDMQIGKVDNGGTAGILDRVFTSHDSALARFKDARKRKQVSEAVIVVAGDCIEGITSQGGNLAAAGRIDLSITEQVRVYRRMLARIVKDYVDVADRVRVLVVPGNHDEAERRGKQVRSYTDSWALDGAAAVAEAMDLAGYGDRVSWVMPKPDELTVCVDVAGTTVGVLHGHQARAGQIGKWLSGQAQNREPIGTADLVISGHYHHLHVQAFSATTWVQVPALDGGSTWWRHAGNTEAPPGMVSMLVGGGSWRSLELN